MFTRINREQRFTKFRYTDNKGGNSLSTIEDGTASEQFLGAFKF